MSTPARRQSKPRAEPLTPEQVKALADQLDWAGQTRLHDLFVADPKSTVGAVIRTHREHFYRERQLLEQRLGIAPGQIDPEGLLTTVETDKQAMKRTGRKSTDAVKTARHKARKKIDEEAVPPRSLPLR
jgi:hypothetical protein